MGIAGLGGKLPRKLCLTALLQGFDVLGLGGGVLLHELEEYLLHIAHHGNGGVYIFADLRRVHINMDGLHSPSDLRGLEDGAVCHPCAHQNQQIGMRQGSVCGRGTEGADHAHIQRMIGGHNAKPHHGADNGNLGLFRKFQRFLLGACTDDAAAQTEHRLFRLTDCLRRPMHLLDVALYRGLVAPNVHGLGIHRLELRLLHIDGNINEHGTRTSGGGNVERLLHHSGDALNVLYQIAMFNEGSHSAGDVHLLENIPSQQIALHLTGNGNHRNGVHIGGGNAGDKVGCPRTGGDHAYANLAADSGIAGRHMSGVLLGAGQGIMNVRMLQGVRRRADGSPGIAEDFCYVFPLQALNQSLCTCCHDVLAPLLVSSWFYLITKAIPRKSSREFSLRFCVRKRQFPAGILCVLQGKAAHFWRKRSAEDRRRICVVLPKRKQPRPISFDRTKLTLRVTT